MFVDPSASAPVVVLVKPESHPATSRKAATIQQEFIGSSPHITFRAGNCTRAAITPSMPFSSRAPGEILSSLPSALAARPTVAACSAEAMSHNLPHWLRSNANAPHSNSMQGATGRASTKGGTLSFLFPEDSQLADGATVPVYLHLKRDSEQASDKQHLTDHAAAVSFKPTASPGLGPAALHGMLPVALQQSCIAMRPHTSHRTHRLTSAEHTQPPLPDISLRDLHEQLASLDGASNTDAVQALASALEQYAQVLKSVSRGSLNEDARHAPGRHSSLPALGHSTSQELSPPTLTRTECNSPVPSKSSPNYQLLPSGHATVLQDNWNGSAEHKQSSGSPVWQATQHGQASTPKSSLQYATRSGERSEMSAFLQNTAGHTDAKINLLTEALKPLLQQLVENSGSELDCLLASQADLSRESVLEWVLQHCGKSNSSNSPLHGSLPKMTIGLPDRSSGHMPMSGAISAPEIAHSCAFVHASDLTANLGEVGSIASMALSMNHRPPIQLEQDNMPPPKRLCVRLSRAPDDGHVVQPPRLELGLSLSGVPLSAALEQGQWVALRDATGVPSPQRRMGEVPKAAGEVATEGWDVLDGSSPCAAGRKLKRPCHYPGCGKHSQQNMEGHQLYCIAHMRQCGMQPRRQFCAHEGCSKEVVTSLNGQRTYCKSHMREHGLLPRYRQCQHENCTKQVKTSSDGQRLYCKSHMREHGMKPKYKPCQHPGCENRAEPCTAGQHIYCKSHMRARGLEPKYK